MQQRLLATVLLALSAVSAQRTYGYEWQPFKRVQPPPVPEARDPEWSRNPIDAFIAAEHSAHNLKPRPEADRPTLLRRVYLDLIGLPPTPDELRAFLADNSRDAYEKVVDRLLSSPQYGERWGRHWMDVWRYSDWAGYGAEVRESQRHIWRWRDWIVESLNEDKGYDRMVQEMLAGDELAPDDPQVLRATGFLARNWYLFNRNVWIENTVEHTSKAFLGLTMSCARCHEHKFDPISQEEYYQFRAFFEPYLVRIDRLPGQPDVQKDGVARAFDGQPDVPTFLFERGNEAKPDKSRPFAPTLPACFDRKLDIKPLRLPRAAYAPERRGFVIVEILDAARAQVETARPGHEQASRAAVVAEIALLFQSPVPLTATLGPASLAAENLKLPALNLAAAQATFEALEAVLAVEKLEDEDKKDSEEWKQLAIRALQLQRTAAVMEAERNLQVAKQALSTAPSKTQPDLAQKVTVAEKALGQAQANAKLPESTAFTRRTFKTYPETSTGRRLALAQWITDRQNPLAARVAVNHIWLRHFGKPLVPSVFDFGKNGKPPTHPALLDWLASELMASSWSMKSLHRLIVTSRAYRMDSRPDAECAAADPENRWLWRMNPRRLEAEAIRDDVLYVGGRLDLATGGPEIDQTQGLTIPRRSIYFRHAYEKQMEFLALFDNANVSECYQRNESIAPQQALALANSSLALNQSRLLARALHLQLGATSNAETDAAFIRAGFERILSRSPTADELTVCTEFLTKQAALFADKQKLTPFPAPALGVVPPSTEPVLRSREDLIHVLLNHHEFVTIR